MPTVFWYRDARRESSHMGRRHRHKRQAGLRTTAGDLDEKVYHFLKRDGGTTYIGTKEYYRAACGKLFEFSSRDVTYPNCRACVTTIPTKAGIAIGTSKFKFTKVKEQSFAPPLGELE